MVCCIVVIFLGATQSSAQFKTVFWDDFESGVFPDTLDKIGAKANESIHVLRYTQIRNYQKILTGAAKTECGEGCLVFQITPNSRYLRVVSKSKFDRKNMGENTTAIVQADLFLKRLSEPMSGLAVLATQINPETPQVIDRMYRLGVDGKGFIYFSYWNKNDPQLNEKSEDYPREDMNRYNLKIPGWHRFRMAFKSQGKIHCYVDGVETSFSPITETSLDTLQMGVMVASSSTTAVDTCITDNLSIQVADEDIPLPISPWRDEYNPHTANPLAEDFPVSNAPNPLAVGIPQLAQSTQSVPLSWFKTVPEAVQSNTQRLSYLVLYYSPYAKANMELDRIISTDMAVREYLRHFVLVSVDVNQLGGGALAQKFGVFRFPCFMQINTKGDEVSRSIFKSGMKWDDVHQQLNQVARN